MLGLLRQLDVGEHAGGGEFAEESISKSQVPDGVALRAELLGDLSVDIMEQLVPACREMEEANGGFFERSMGI